MPESRVVGNKTVSGNEYSNWSESIHVHNVPGTACTESTILAQTLLSMSACLYSGFTKQNWAFVMSRSYNYCIRWLFRYSWCAAMNMWNSPRKISYWPFGPLFSPLIIVELSSTTMYCLVDWLQNCRKLFWYRRITEMVHWFLNAC